MNIRHWRNGKLDNKIKNEWIIGRPSYHSFSHNKSQRTRHVYFSMIVSLNQKENGTCY